nr:hypothetical protein [Anaerolineae bacterium]
MLYQFFAYRQTGTLGFPLDDSWIHQTYARSLAQTGQWAFVPGIPSAGSTSVLWTLLISPVFLVSNDARIWTYILGMLSLFAGAAGASRLIPAGKPAHALAVSAAVALEWHLVWASASGMETMLFAALVVWFWVWVLSQYTSGYTWQQGLLLGLFGGGLFLARPEGIVAAGIAGAAWLIRSRGRMRDRILWAASAAFGLAAILLPLFMFNSAIGDTLFPNTFYAKQTEYALLWNLPLIGRLFDQFRVVFVGAQVLLIPVLVLSIWQAARRGPHELWLYLPLVWCVSHLVLYAIRLPVTYQHGRYAMPVIPVLLAYGMMAVLRLANPGAGKRGVRMLSMAWLASTAVLFPSTLVVLGAPAYSRDVDFIELEMVATARWLADNTLETDLIAAHDIGAIGYFAEVPLLDLAGLVSPDVIPFMTDPERLGAYVVESGADYLVVFPRWNRSYRKMVSAPVFQAVWSSDRMPGYRQYADLGPMTVYRVLP